MPLQAKNLSLRFVSRRKNADQLAQIQGMRGGSHAIEFLAVPETKVVYHGWLNRRISFSRVISRRIIIPESAKEIEQATGIESRQLKDDVEVFCFSRSSGFNISREQQTLLVRSCESVSHAAI